MESAPTKPPRASGGSGSGSGSNSSGSSGGGAAGGGSGGGRTREQIEFAHYKATSLLGKHLSSRFFINNVSLKGIENTKIDLVYQILAPLVDTTSLSDILSACSSAAQRLDKTGIFSDVDFLIDHSPGAANAVDIIVSLRENRRLSMTVGSFVGSKDLNIAAGGKIFNVAGRGETLETAFELGFSGLTPTSTFVARYNKPYFFHEGHFAQGWAFRQENHFPESSYKESKSGAGFKYKFPSRYCDHEVSYRASWRENIINNETSVPVRLMAGDTFKSSIKHKASIDTRDDRALPKRGYSVAFTQELAGLGGDVRFLKGLLQASFGQTLTSDVSVAGYFNGGVLINIPGTGLYHPRGSSINDRFFVGGHSTVRGFSTGGIGPCAYRQSAVPDVDVIARPTDALGGDVFWCGGLHLYKAVLDPAYQVYGQCFVNAGTVIPRTEGAGVLQHGGGLISGLRASVGVGLACRTALGRLEINYCHPVRKHTLDKGGAGIQVGISIDIV